MKTLKFSVTFTILLTLISISATAVESNYFRVKIRTDKSWNRIEAYQTNNPLDSSEDASWVSFDVKRKTKVRIFVANLKVDSVTIRPKNFNIPFQVEKNSITIEIDKPIQISVEINGDNKHPLYIFANPPMSRPLATNQKLITFKRGVHQIGERYPLESNTCYFLEEGAYLMGSLYGKGARENITITGRGIIDSGHQKWQHPTKGLLSNILFEDGRNIRIEGVTCINAGNFQIKIQTKQANTEIKIQNVKLIGWNHNTDGIHVSDMDWKDSPQTGNSPGTRLSIEDCFIRANDDAMLLCDGVAASFVKNCIIWDNGGGASFCISWGAHNNVDSCRVENCYVIHKNGNNPVFRALHAGEAQIKNITFQDICIEGNVKTLIGLKITNHRYDSDPGLGSIKNIVFRNINLQGNTEKNFIEGFNTEHTIENILFENLSINGKKVSQPYELHLTTNEFTKYITFLTK